MTVAENNKRIAKNTIFLYIRMLLIMLVSLYTSRVILQTLGIEDFGVYNVVAGIVVLFAFVNNAMATASQRYLSFALGKNDDQEVKKVFSMSLTSHLVIALIVLLVTETLGILLLQQMNFPKERLTAVFWTYQFAVFTCIAQIIRVPYNASVIAHEKMSFYAWISIVEVILKLLIVYLLLIWDGDRLIFYSFLLFAVTVLIGLIYKLYCNRQFHTTKYSFYWNRKLFNEFFSFSGWSLAGSLANVSATQGVNMIINIFCGVVVNAAVGISNQVMGAIWQFLGSFQTAFSPQLVKSYAMNDKEYFMNLVFKSSKFSYYLMFIISFPILLNCDFFLHFWLDEVPLYATEFSQLMIISVLFDAISGPLWISVQATGKIKNYQLLMSVLILLNLPISYFILYLGLSPIYVFGARIVINAVILFVRLAYLQPFIHLPIKDYFVQVLLVIVGVTVVSIPIPLWLNMVMETKWENVILISLLCVILSIIVIYHLGMTKKEKQVVYEFILKKIKR